ncbi:hypothetical protein [Komagataeibacter europaeus]|nr:hypothetical protein [Komagataeibacter europaeus]
MPDYLGNTCKAVEEIANVISRAAIGAMVTKTALVSRVLDNAMIK